MKTLVLYTTLGCHLCEQAKTVLWPLLSEKKLSLKELDIAENPQWMDRYALQIPVIMREDSGAELAWPFDEGTAATFLQDL